MISSSLTSIRFPLFLLLLFLLPATALAQCPAFELSPGKLRFTPGGEKDPGEISAHRTDTNSLAISIELKARNDAGITQANTEVPPEHFTQLLFLRYEPNDAGDLTQILTGELTALVQESGRPLLSYRNLEGDGGYSTLIFTPKAEDPFAFTAQCIPSTDTSFDYSAWISQQYLELGAAELVGLIDYSPACDQADSQCFGPFISNYLLTSSAAPGGEINASGTQTSNLRQANRLILAATRTRGVDRRKAYLSQAATLANRYLREHPRLSTRPKNILRRAIQNAQRATRRGARSQEVSSALRGLQSAMRGLS